jgi:hypothetical protein
VPSAPGSPRRFIYDLRHVESGRIVTVEHLGPDGRLKPVAGFDDDFPFDQHSADLQDALGGGSGSFELEYYSVTHR